MTNSWLAVVIISVSGAFGGIVLGIVNRTNYSICIPGGRTLKLGFFADSLIGCAAALAIFSIAGSIFNIDLTKLDNTQNIIKIVAIGILAGFAGISLLRKLSNNMLNKIDDLDQKIDNLQLDIKSRTFVERGVLQARIKEYESAIEYYDHALEIFPRNTRALINKGFALKKMGQVESALECALEALSIDPVLANAAYNSACYITLLDGPKHKILQHLKVAFKEFPHLKKVANKDSDFDRIREDEDFRCIVD